MENTKEKFQLLTPETYTKMIQELLDNSTSIEEIDANDYYQLKALREYAEQYMLTKLERKSLNDLKDLIKVAYEKDDKSEIEFLKHMIMNYKQLQEIEDNYYMVDETTESNLA